MNKPMPIGVSDFKEVVEKYYYADKTLLMKDMIDNNIKVLLITRPRRFGKTINMSMIKCYFENSKEDNRGLFKGLNIEKAGEKYNGYLGKYPVIYLTLKDIKCTTWDESYEKLINLIANEYDRHSVIVKSNKLSDREKKLFHSICNEEASKTKYEASLGMLTEYLTRYYGVKPILLIDEYDIPIQSGFMNDFYQDVIGFMRNWLSGGLKDNVNLEFAVLTGILRVAKESIFSGLNNLEIASVLDKPYNQYFGFTEEEIKEMTMLYHREDKLDEIKSWYDGYNFAGLEIYNPWSVINYINRDCNPAAYWLNTSSNDIIHDLIKRADNDYKNELRSLFDGNVVESMLDTNIVYDNLYKGRSYLYSFLVSTGYLKPISCDDMIPDMDIYTLAIPNREIKIVYRNEILNHFSEGIEMDYLANLLRTLLHGDVKTFTELFNKLLIKTISYYDSSEDFYHGFMLGMTVLLIDNYMVKSNRESGYGRFDLVLIPRNQKLFGVVMEFKVVEDENKLVKEADEALLQIEEKKYDSEMRDYGVTSMYKYGIAFKGKKFAIRLADS